ncbi:response regulator [Thalassotalea aquiviva]|uniref:response regulator n=1 Tax=Thalassotalea aquiviva TaxID=3242415 RepID=UPI003529F672
MDYVKEVNKKKILVCDDDPTHLLLMQEVLSADGFDVICAADGVSSVSQYVLHKPDIVLLDVEMPEKSGFQVCKEIRNTDEGEDIPILMITGAGDIDSIAKSFDVGATDFLQKPIKWPVISHRVAYMLHSSQYVYDLKNTQSRLNYLAYFDSLTGLANKQSLLKYMHARWQSRQVGEDPMSIVTIQLGFLNSAYAALGPLVGDKLIQKMAEILKSYLCAKISVNNDAFCLSRNSDDEFIFCLPTESVDRIKHLLDDLLSLLATPVQVDDYHLYLTPRIGVAVTSDEVFDPEKLLSRSLIASKQAEINRYRIYSKAQKEQLLVQLSTEQKVRKALIQNQVGFQFHPIANHSNNAIDYRQLQVTHIGNEAFNDAFDAVLKQGVTPYLQIDFYDWKLRRLSECFEQLFALFDQKVKILLPIPSYVLSSERVFKKLEQLFNQHPQAQHRLIVQVLLDTNINDVKAHWEITRLCQFVPCVSLFYAQNNLQQMNRIEHAKIDSIKVSLSALKTLDNAQLSNFIDNFCNKKVAVIVADVDRQGDCEDAKSLGFEMLQGNEISKQHGVISFNR